MKIADTPLELAQLVAQRKGRVTFVTGTDKRFHECPAEHWTPDTGAIVAVAWPVGWTYRGKRKEHE